MALTSMAQPSSSTSRSRSNARGILSQLGARWSPTRHDARRSGLRLATLRALLALGLTVLLGVPPAEAVTVPSGFRVVAETDGIRCYQKDYPGGQPDFVLVADLDRARFTSILADRVDARRGVGPLGGDDPSFRKMSLEALWDRARARDAQTFAVFNGQFFDNVGGAVSRLAFSIHTDGDHVSDGYGTTSEFPGQIRLLQVDNDAASATIRSFDAGAFRASGGPDERAAGLDTEANKGPGSWTGRTFLGVHDANGDGRNETLLVFVSKISTQGHARDILSQFGARGQAMFDGGGSTQLIVQGRGMANSSRPIPHAFALISDPPPACSHGCSEGATRCRGDGAFERCGNHDGDPCREWGGRTSCGERERCEDGRCVARCTDGCEVGSARCAGDSIIEGCGDHDGDGCAEWGEVADCGPGRRCTIEGGEAVCDIACDDRCEGGTRRCVDGHPAECGLVAPHPCLDWHEAERCDAGFSCVDGACQRSREGRCDDGRDDNGDGLVDCDDPSCAGVPPCPAVPERCDDRWDNDGDGDADCADADCSEAVACGGVELCNNGADDDGDGRVDCDDDDCDDTDRCRRTAELCVDGSDNDRDGAADCDDDDCSWHPVCGGDGSLDAGIDAGSDVARDGAPREVVDAEAIDGRAEPPGDANGEPDAGPAGAARVTMARSSAGCRSVSTPRSQPSLPLALLALHLTLLAVRRSARRR